jgi:hypothetical protein
MFVIAAEKNGKWIELTTEDEIVIDTITEGLKKDGYGRISVREE